MKSDKTSRTMGPLMDTQAWVSACFLFSEGAFNTFKVKLSVFFICLLFYLFYFHFYSWCSQFLCPSLTLSPPLFLPFFFCFYGRSFKVVQVFLLFTSGSSSAKEKLKHKHFCYIYILDISTKHTGFRALFLYQICMFYWCFCDLYSGLEKLSGRHRRAVIPVRRKVAKILFYFKQIVQKFIVIGGYSWPFLCGVSPGEVGGAMSGQSCLAERRWGGGRGGSVGGVLAVAETFSTTETQRLLKRNHGDPRQSCVLSNRTIVNKKWENQFSSLT